MTLTDEQRPPQNGDEIVCGPLVIRVGWHNGDFRAIFIRDFHDRPIADGSVPVSALQEIRDQALRDGV